MYTPENEAARPEMARAEDKAAEAGNLKGNDKSPASKLIAEADEIAKSIPFMLTYKNKQAAGALVLNLWLQALLAKRTEKNA